MRDSSITQNKIAAGNIANAALAEQAVTGNKIAGSTIEGYHLMPGAVDTAQLKDGAVTTAKLAGNAVTTAKLADGSVTTAKLAFNAVTPAQLTKAYRAGSMNLAILPLDFVPLVAGSFGIDFDTAPLVMPRLTSSPRGMEAGSYFQITSVSSPGFSSRVLMPESFSSGHQWTHSGYTGSHALAAETIGGYPCSLFAYDVSASGDYEVHFQRPFPNNNVGNQAVVISDFSAKECALSSYGGLPLALYRGEASPSVGGNEIRLALSVATTAKGVVWSSSFSFENADASK